MIANEIQTKLSVDSGIPGPNGKLVPGLPPPIWIAVGLMLLTIFGIWPALTNGQPFFYADTTAYVRGADLAISKLFGSRFATDWAKDPRRTIERNALTSISETASGHQQPPSPVPLAGRSIIYGVLLYFGEVFGGMWFPILLQSSIATYLLFLFVVKVLEQSFGCFVVTCVAVFLGSTAPFFVSYLMPDIFAGLLILSFATLAVGWGRLTRSERGMLSVVALFAVLVHTSHLMLLFGLTVVTVGYAAVATYSQINVRRVAAVAAGCLIVGILWEITFSFAVNRALGAPAIHPPFLTAKLVSTLGEPAVADLCRQQSFVVCQFQDRFPIDNKSFLWSTDKRVGVFNVVDTPTRRLLGKEQLAFALAIIPPNFGHFVAGFSLDFLRQLTQFNLDEYSYTPSGLEWFKTRLPVGDFNEMSASVASRSDIYAIFGRTFLYIAAIGGAIVTLTLLAMALYQVRKDPCAHVQDRLWCTAISILLAGFFLNAAICGGFSDVNNRYQARVVWLIQLCAISGTLVLRPYRKAALYWKTKGPEIRSGSFRLG